MTTKTLSVSGIASAHSYSNNMNQTWTLSSTGATSITITFSTSTEMESSYDYLYILKSDGSQFGKYSGTALAGQTITVPGDKVTLRMTSDGSVTKWGFALTSATATVEINGHDLVHHVAKAPTCTAIGWEAYDTCSRCSYTTYVELPALGHDYNTTVIPPTCTARGYTMHTCTRCGDSYVDSYVDMLEHSYTATVTPPTCTAQGYTTYTCSRCGDSYVGSYTEALGHDNASVVTPPTCTERGYTTYTCSRCGDSYVGSYVAATGHRDVSVVTPPTCTERGYTTYTCSVCGDSFVANYVPALGHKYSAEVTLPTCTKKGYTTYRCSVCGESHTDDEVAALGHDYTAVVIRDAAAGSTGEIRYTCTHCGDIYVETIPMIDAAAPQIVLENKSACNGGTVTVAVSLKNNPGVASLRLLVEHDDGLDLTGFIFNGTIGGTAQEFSAESTPTNPVTLLWFDGAKNLEGDAVIATLTFKVKENAAFGNHRITLTYDPENIYNSNGDNVDFAVVNGAVFVSKVAILSAVRDGKNVRVTVNAAAQADRVCVALYDAQGKMIGVKLGAPGTWTFQKAEKAAYVKAFAINGSFAPICAPVTAQLPN